MKKQCKVMFHDGAETVVDADDWQRIEEQIHCYRNGRSVAVFDSEAVRGVIVEEYNPHAWQEFVDRNQLPDPTYADED